MNKILIEELWHEAKKLEEKTGKKGKIVRALVKWQEGDKINQNGRLYPITILQREAQKIQDKIDKGETVWGHAYHPADSQGRTVDISHRWDKVWSKGKNFYGEITILPTPHGKMIQELVKHGKLSMSSRGLGTTTEKSRGEKKYVEVNNDFDLKTPGDFVISPSVEGAELIKVIESQKIENLLTVEKVQELEEMLEETEEGMSLEEFDEKVEAYLYANYLTSDHYLSNQFDEFKRDHESRYKKVLAERFQKEGIKLSKGITEGEKKVEKFESRAGLSFRDFDICGASLAEREKYKEQIVESNVTGREKQLYREALRAGVNLSFKEWRAKYGKVEPVRVRAQQLTADEQKKRKERNDLQETIRMDSVAGKTNLKHNKKLED